MFNNFSFTLTLSIQVENIRILNFEVFLKEPTTITWWNIAVVEAFLMCPLATQRIHSVRFWQSSLKDMSSRPEISWKFFCNRFYLLYFNLCYSGVLFKWEGFIQITMVCGAASSRSAKRPRLNECYATHRINCMLYLFCKQRGHPPAHTNIDMISTAVVAEWNLSTLCRCSPELPLSGSFTKIVNCSAEFDTKGSQI